MPAATRPHRRPRAFTLLELIVTIVVLAVLAALAVPATSAIQDKARDAELVTELETLGRGVAALAAFDPADGVQASDLEAFLAAEADAADGPASTGGWALVTAGVPEPGELRVGNGGQLLPVTTPVAHRDETVAYLLIGSTGSVAELVPASEGTEPNDVLRWFGLLGAERQSVKAPPVAGYGPAPEQADPVGDGTSWTGAATEWNPVEHAWHVAGNRSSYTGPLVPFDPDAAYHVSLDVKRVAGDGRFYAGIRNYDVDKLVIHPHHVMWSPGSLTTLTQDLRPGDTEVHLADSSGWIETTAGSQNGIVTYDYVASDGTSYAAGSYSRHSWTDLYGPGSIDRTGHVISLDAPWPHHEVAAGTAVANARSGMVFDYVAASNQAPADEWQTFAGTYVGVGDPDGSYRADRARPGTAYISFSAAMNYDAPDGVTAVRNVRLEPLGP